MPVQAEVVAIDGDMLTVVPEDPGCCIGCGDSECRKRGGECLVLNRKKLDVRAGSVIRYASPARNQARQGLVSVGVPVVSAISVFMFLSGCFPGLHAGMRYGAALSALLIAATLVYRLYRPGDRGYPEIIEIV